MENSARTGIFCKQIFTLYRKIQFTGRKITEKAGKINFFDIGTDVAL